jgi:hypothetical protein
MILIIILEPRSTVPFWIVTSAMVRSIVLESQKMSEYNVKRLIPPEFEIKGKLLPNKNKVVFEPDEEYAERIEIPIDKIKDVRFATEKDISALRVWLVGPVLGALWKKEHRILVIDVEDEYGIVQHLTFEGDNEIVDAERELYDIRKADKLRESNLQVPDYSRPPEKPEHRLHWNCPKCLRQNAMKARFCTRCGCERPEK